MEGTPTVGTPMEGTQIRRDGMEERHVIILTPDNRELEALHRIISEHVLVLRQICREEKELLPFFAEQILLDLKVCRNLLSLLEEARAIN